MVKPIVGLEISYEDIFKLRNQVMYKGYVVKTGTSSNVVDCYSRKKRRS